MKKILSFLLVAGFIAGCYYDKSNLSTPTQPAAPSSIFTVVYSVASSTITVGTAGSSGIPTIVNTVGGSVSFKLLSAPSGVTVDTTGNVKWSAAVAVGTYNFTVVATNISQVSDSLSFALNVNPIGAAVVAPSGFSYSPASTSSKTGAGGSSNAPIINTGGATVTYTLTNPPSGVTINASTGIISWASSLAIGTYTLSITATNSAGSATTTFSLQINSGVYIVSFKKDILPVISTECATCHSQSSHPTWTQWSTIYTSATSISAKLYPVGNMPLNSTLPLIPTSEVSTGLFRDLFNLWISQGKPNN